VLVNSLSKSMRNSAPQLCRRGISCRRKHLFFCFVSPASPNSPSTIFCPSPCYTWLLMPAQLWGQRPLAAVTLARRTFVVMSFSLPPSLSFPLSSQLDPKFGLASSPEVRLLNSVKTCGRSNLCPLLPPFLFFGFFSCSVEHCFLDSATIAAVTRERLDQKVLSPWGPVGSLPPPPASLLLFYRYQ